MAKKLWKTVEAIQELLQGTSAKVTLEWGDGTKVVITKHVIGARRPEKPKMVPMDDAELYSIDIPWFPREGNVKIDEITFVYSSDGPIEKHDKIQGDDNNPWIVNDDGSPTP